MLRKVLAITIVLGVVSAIPGDIIDPSYESKSDVKSLILNIVSTAVGHKITAIGFAVAAIEWLISNIFFIIFGAASVLGFCKFTEKCSFSYNEYPAVTKVFKFITPEYLETAERFLVTAVEKYAEKKKREI